MKKILINGRFTSHHFAIRNVIYNVVKELSHKKDLSVYVLLNKDSEMLEFKRLRVNILTNPLPANNAPLNHLYTMFILPFILLFKHIDLVIYPQICIYLFNPCKSILYLHDLIEFYLNNQDKKRMIFRKLSYPYVCKHADYIVTVSNNTKKDIIKFLNTPANKIVVAYNGCAEDLKPIDMVEAANYVKDKYDISDYIFYIGYLSHPQKNLIYLINEFKRILINYPSLNLVFAGPQGKDADLILEAVKNSNLGSHFKYLGKVPFSDLKYLYSGCRLFCFPSIYEGFGMPVLEAMTCGAPVITSNISSMPEILQDDKYLIDPYKDGDLSSKANELLSLDRDLISKVNINASKSFSWNNHGKILYNLIVKHLLN